MKKLIALCLLLSFLLIKVFAEAVVLDTLLTAEKNTSNFWYKNWQKELLKNNFYKTNHLEIKMWATDVWCAYDTQNYDIRIGEYLYHGSVTNNYTPISRPPIKNIDCRGEITWKNLQ